MNDTVFRSPSLGPCEMVYENPYQKVYRQVADFGDFSKEYFIARYGKRAAVLVVRGEEVLLGRQYRLLINACSWEVPGGKVEDGEALETAAIRECFEETGVRCANLKPLVRFQASLDTVDGPTDVFYTREFVEVDVRHDAREVQSHAWVPLTRCLQMVFEHKILDSLSIISLLTYRLLQQQAPGTERR